MVTLKSTAAIYLLDPGLESLHKQSVGWISDIAFWRDEAAFLYALEVKKTLKDVPVDAKNKLEKIENELVKIAGGELDKLYDEVTAHENFLNTLLESKREDEQSYRDKHLKIAEKIDIFNLRFRMLKAEIFDLVRESKGDVLEEVLGIKRNKKIVQK